MFRKRDTDDPMAKEGEDILDLQAETIPVVDQAPVETPKELPVKNIDLSESKPLSASPKITPAAETPTTGRNEASGQQTLDRWRRNSSER